MALGRDAYWREKEQEGCEHEVRPESFSFVVIKHQDGQIKISMEGCCKHCDAVCRKIIRIEETTLKWRIV